MPGDVEKLADEDKKFFFHRSRLHAMIKNRQIGKRYSECVPSISVLMYRNLLHSTGGSILLNWHRLSWGSQKAEIAEVRKQRKQSFSKMIAWCLRFGFYFFVFNFRRLYTLSFGNTDQFFAGNSAM